MTSPHDADEVEALLTDRYIDSLLAAAERHAHDAPAEPALDPSLRRTARLLRRDLVRVHPSFRFEERLALRLAEAAAAMRLPMAAGAEGQVAHIPVAPGFDPLGVLPDDEPSTAATADLWRGAVRGAVAASALSLAGAAWYAWRHRPVTSPMARAARAAHAARRI